MSLCSHYVIRIAVLRVQHCFIDCKYKHYFGNQALSACEIIKKLLYFVLCWSAMDEVWGVGCRGVPFFNKLYYFHTRENLRLLCFIKSCGKRVHTLHPTPFISKNEFWLLGGWYFAFGRMMFWSRADDTLKGSGWCFGCGRMIFTYAKKWFLPHIPTTFDVMRCVLIGYW